MARRPVLVWGPAREAAGREQALTRERSPDLKSQDESYGISATGRASRGVAPGVSGCEMPSR